MKIFKKEKKEQLDSKAYELYYIEHLMEILIKNNFKNSLDLCPYKC